MAAARMSCSPASNFMSTSTIFPKQTCRLSLPSGLPFKAVAPSRSSAQRRLVSAAPASIHYAVTKISGAEFNALLANEREFPMVVDFYAAWCGPCVIIAQELERLAVEFEDEVLFLKIDTDDEYALAHKLQVRGLPTVFFISKNPEKNVIRTEGILPNDVYRKIIREDLLCEEPLVT